MKALYFLILYLFTLVPLSAEVPAFGRFDLPKWLEMEAEVEGVDSRAAEWARLLQKVRDQVRLPESVDRPEAAETVLKQIDGILTEHGLVYRSSTGKGTDVLISPALSPAALSVAERQELLEFDPQRFQAEHQRRSNVWRLGRPEPTPAQLKRLRDDPEAVVYFADCDRLSILYWGIGQALDLPLEFVSAPRHAYVRWRFADGSHLNWEATNGSSLPDTFYENLPGNSPEAIAQGTYLNALTDAELCGYWLAMRAQVAINLNQVESAREDLQNSLELYPANPVAWNRFGLLEESAGRSEDAIQAFSNGLNYDASQASLWFNRGRLYSEAGQYVECIEDLREALRIDPRHDGAWTTRAELFERSGRLPQAFQDFSRALELNPENVSALTGRSNVLRALGHPQRALADIERALRLDPNNHIHYGNRALSYFMLGQVKEGLADLDRAIEMQPGEKLLYANRAALRASTENFAGAVEDYSRVLEIDPSFTSAYKGRAASYHHLGNTEAAKQDVLTLFRLDPKASGLEDWMEKLRPPAGE